MDEGCYRLLDTIIKIAGLLGAILGGVLALCQWRAAVDETHRKIQADSLAEWDKLFYSRHVLQALRAIDEGCMRVKGRSGAPGDKTREIRVSVDALASALLEAAQDRHERDDSVVADAARPGLASASNGGPGAEEPAGIEKAALNRQIREKFDVFLFNLERLNMLMNQGLVARDNQVAPLPYYVGVMKRSSMDTGSGGVRLPISGKSAEHLLDVVVWYARFVKYDGAADLLRQIASTT